MKKTIIIVLVLVVAGVVTVVIIQRQSPSGQAPDLDAAAIETGKNLHPPKLNP